MTWYSIFTRIANLHITALNLLTAEVIREAAKEIKEGRHVQLDLPLHQPEVAGFGRPPMQHRLVDMQSKGFVGFDDEIYLNTQSSSQWDSLKHVSSTLVVAYPIPTT